MNGSVILVIVCLLVALLAHIQMGKVPGYSNPQEFHTNATNYGLLDMVRFIALVFAGATILVKILDI